MESSSSSAPSQDSDQDNELFVPGSQRSILLADLINTTDRRLLLGALERDNDLEPRKAKDENQPQNDDVMQYPI